MVDGRSTHDADRIRTALGWRYGDRGWRARPTQSRSGRPIADRLYTEHLSGKLPCRDVLDGKVDEFEAVVPGVARIVRSSLWILLKGRELNSEFIVTEKALPPLSRLGDEYRDLGEIERIVLETELALIVEHPKIGEAHLEEAVRRLGFVGAPSVLREFSGRFLELIDARIQLWRQHLAERHRIARMAPSIANLPGASSPRQDPGSSDWTTEAVEVHQSWLERVRANASDLAGNPRRQTLILIAALFIGVIIFFDDSPREGLLMFVTAPIVAGAASRSAFDWKRENAIHRPLVAT
tara:strand:+ start:400 stop:1284 length:885 start_codon:yes stop_codon:yes gene_type:complete